MGTHSSQDNGIHAIDSHAEVVQEPSGLDVFNDGVHSLLKSLHSGIERLGVSSDVAQLTSQSIGILLIVALSFLSNFIAKRIILRLVNKIIDRSQFVWLKALQAHKFFSRLSHIAPAIVIRLLVPLVTPSLSDLTRICTDIYVLSIVWLLIDSLLNALNTISHNNGISQKIPIKGFTQAIKLIAFLVACILALSIVFGKSPVFFLSGLGALTAVLLLVFRDALLGLVAGVMISVNNMVRTGDWIEMPSAGADGDVIDVSLTTVKVRNWDKTITTIPSYDLISKSFKNWQGMFDSGGRRIKRALYIDMRSVRFLDEEMIKRMMKIRRLRGYLQRKVKEVLETNAEFGDDLEALCNGRRLTNLGTFRAYCEAYLREHGQINQNMLMIVRQLAPTEHGLPLEIYAFTADTRWVVYESIQSDIFDHLISVMKEFELEVFQSPSGKDLQGLIQQAEQKLLDGAVENAKQEALNS